MDTPNTSTDDTTLDQNHIVCGGKVYRRTMDPALFEQQYEHELDRRDKAKQDRIKAAESTKPASK